MIVFSVGNPAIYNAHAGQKHNTFFVMRDLNLMLSRTEKKHSALIQLTL